MATMMMQPGTQVAQMRVIQGGQQESRPQMVGPPLGVDGSPMGPGFTLQMGGFSPASPVPPQQWGPGQQLGGGHMGQPGMGAVEWETQVQQIVDAGGNYGGCAQHTVIGACCAGGPGPWLGPENQYLPGFVPLQPSGSKGGRRNHSNAFLPAVFQGTAIGKAGQPALPMAVP